MDFAFTPEQIALRQELREYFTAMMTPEVEAGLAETGWEGPLYKELVRRIGRDGWLGVGWPTEYGGQGRTPIEQLIFFEEANIAGAPLPSSGQAANFFALFNICNNGDHIVASSAIYGGTFNLINVTMRKMGVECTFVSPDCTEEELEAAFQPNTKAVFGESISNPALIVLDFEKFANAAHRHGVPLIVDNTFPTPINCRPFQYGVDIVTHATTKYMDGHGSCVGGAIVDNRPCHHSAW